MSEFFSLSDLNDEEAGFSTLCKNGDLERVIHFIKTKHSLPNEKRIMAKGLKQAAKFKHEEIVAYLVKHNDYLQAGDFLNEAALSGSLEICKFALEECVTNQIYDLLDTATFNAVRAGHVEIVRYLMSHIEKLDKESKQRILNNITSAAVIAAIQNISEEVKFDGLGLPMYFAHKGGWPHFFQSEGDEEESHTAKPLTVMPIKDSYENYATLCFGPADTTEYWPKSTSDEIYKQLIARYIKAIDMPLLKYIESCEPKYKRIALTLLDN